MPIYEYRCEKCGKKSSRIWMTVPSARAEKDLACPACGAAGLSRLFSRFASPKSEEKRMESMMDPSVLGGLDENDPKGMARLMRRMSAETGEPLAGEEAEMLDRMEAGELPADEEGGGADAGGGGTPEV